MKNVAIFFGSSTGNTELAARQIQQELGEENVQIFDVSQATASQAENFPNLILGASTWGLGDLQDDFYDFLEGLTNVDLSGKKVALVGLGDQECYPDTYVDSMGIIYETLENAGCQFIGHTSTDGYEFDDSKAVQDGEFVGLALDENNQSELTQTRVSQWVEQIKPEFN